MLNDTAMRAIKSRTQHDYVRHVRAFAAFLGRSHDTATAEDVRRFQGHQREHDISESVIGATVSALRFLFGVTLDRPDLSRKLVLAPRPRKLPDVKFLRVLAVLIVFPGWATVQMVPIVQEGVGLPGIGAGLAWLVVVGATAVYLFADWGRSPRDPEPAVEAGSEA